MDRWLLVKDGNVLDATGAAMQERTNLLVRNDRITAIGEGADECRAAGRGTERRRCRR